MNTAVVLGVSYFTYETACGCRYPTFSAEVLEGEFFPERWPKAEGAVVHGHADDGWIHGDDFHPNGEGDGCNYMLDPDLQHEGLFAGE